ncbi:MAG TPA: peptidoglycan-binding protein [Stellaceae bacterium]|nr:peptidoglycan-binding protein [Stellaceae bacterium]
MKRILILLSVLPLMAACNTMRGVGEDMTAAGHALAHSAGETKAAGASPSATVPATASGTSEPVMVQAPSNLSPETIKAVQTSLHQDGYYNGRIDGIIGPKTRAGIAEYQKSKNRPQTGELDTATLNELAPRTVAGSSNPPSQQQ